MLQMIVFDDHDDDEADHVMFEPLMETCHEVSLRFLGKCSPFLWACHTPQLMASSRGSSWLISLCDEPRGGTKGHREGEAHPREADIHVPKNASETMQGLPTNPWMVTLLKVDPRFNKFEITAIYRGA